MSWKRPERLCSMGRWAVESPALQETGGRSKEESGGAGLGNEWLKVLSVGGGGVRVSCKGGGGPLKGFAVGETLCG